MSKRAILALSCTVLLGACAKQNTGDLHRFINEVMAREPQPLEPLPELKQVETFVYEPGERRSPFRLGSVGEQEQVALPTDGIAPDRNRRKQELEQYPLDSIRMVGTLEQDEGVWALVTIQDGTLFRTTTGNYMGQNDGQIVRIAEDRIELNEIVPDGSGGWQERQASIALSE